MGNQDLEFEAVDAASSLMRNYDSTSGTWKFPQKGEFWRAIHAAHDRGVRGKGSRIAVIDRAFDLSIPQLKPRGTGIINEWASPSENIDHGNAVALLISEVAPDAEIDFYSIGDNGHPDERLLLKALALVAKSDATLVNLSLGRRANHAPMKAATSVSKAHCNICEAAHTAATKNRLILAAVGNQWGKASCPARDSAVLGIGFNKIQYTLTQTTEGGSAEIAEWDSPSYKQAFDADCTLEQPEGVLGSSFATPLITGAIALVEDRTQIPVLFKALKLAGDAELYHVGLSKNSPASDIRYTREAYLKALSSLPHQHNADSSNPPCTMCSIFAQGVYVNAGLFFLETHHFDKAYELLKVARWLAPWSPHALANYATLLRAMGEDEYQNTHDRNKAFPMFVESELEYARALDIRPGFEAYRTGLQQSAQWIFKLS